MHELPSIPEFYRDKTIFITGGSGFIGKVLIEKLLRCCPDVRAIYLLMREKKGRTAEERIRGITDLPLFDLLRSENPDSLKKIRIVVGDVRQLVLGLSSQEQQLLIDEVNVVFHAAASVRFDESLTDAVIMNTRGTREVAQLALRMKNLDVFVHISTTYCYTDREVVEERLYPTNADWKATIEIAENVDRHTLNVLTEKYIHPQPNTYVFAKALAEHVVYDTCQGKIPVVIYRPSVVIHTAKEPVPGWIDNFNGPIGLSVGTAKGILRIVYADPNTTTDYIPVDTTVNSIIATSWRQATYKNSNERLSVSVYNGSNNNRSNVTQGASMAICMKVAWETPVNDILWYPNLRGTTCFYSYFIQMIFYHMLPALLIDGLLKCMARKPKLFKIQKKIYNANLAVAYFSLHQWTFVNDKLLQIENELLPEDVDKFSVMINVTDEYSFYKKSILGARKYLLNEGEHMEKAMKHTRRMWILAQVVNFLWYLGLFWVLIVKIDVVSIVTNKWNDVVLYFMND